VIVGVPREIKSDEYRVGMIPVGVEMLTRAGHRVLVEADAGVGSGLSDEEYVKNGAEIVPDASSIFGQADMVVKVKEPLPAETPLLRKYQIVFTYFHFAADRALTQDVCNSGCVAIAYETIEDRNGELPLLKPMSEVAGKMSIQEGAKYLERPQEGRGILLGGVPGVEPGQVLILGGGVVGTNAAKIAAGMGARVVIMDINLERLRYLDDVMAANVDVIFSDAHTVRSGLASADLVIGAVLIPGARCPNLITRDDLKYMKPGAVIVDVGVDQGGCCETTHPTTHGDPVYMVDGVLHYAVANMPGAVGRTSTFALNNATLPYVLTLAEMGYVQACRRDPGLARGINVQNGNITHQSVAEAFDMAFEPAKL